MNYNLQIIILLEIINFVAVSIIRITDPTAKSNELR